EGKTATRPGPVAVPPNPTSAPSAVQGTTDPGFASATASAKPQESAENSVVQPAKSAAKVFALLAAESRTEMPESPKSPEPAIAAEKEDSYDRDDDFAPRSQRRSAPLVMALAAILVVATLWALYGLMHQGNGAGPAKHLSAPATASAPPTQKPAAAKGSGAAMVALTTPGWRVIAYTYLHEAQAQHKAEAIRQRFPQLSPGIFALHGKAPYLVTLGGVMSRADAFALRNKAVQMGLPRDTYAQNYR
ncbi:MAG TPA: hypothetical protein VMD92_02510, partial [Acidobacteriaceae bacterium]|nr:hypothetical protein [Acidobacteriaceae bacterium]